MQIESGQQPAFAAQIAAAADHVAATWSLRPRLGVVLGTGLSSASELLETDASVPYASIPHFPRCSADSHQGRLLCGRLAGAPAVMMDGRCHLYEGYAPAALMLPIYVMARLGVELLIISNASGGLNPRFRSGDVMVIRDHLSFMPLVNPEPLDGTAPFRRGPITPYDAQLADFAAAVARHHDFPLHQGVYVGVTGPNYETRAEYRMFRQMGADAVGMSTVPEALAASRCGLRTLGLSVVTNVASPDVRRTVSSEEVIAAAAHSATRLRHIVLAVAQEVTRRTANGGDGRAMNAAGMRTG